MKAALIMIAIVVAILAAVYYGDTGSFDPRKQGEEALAQMKPGMSWTQVESIAGEPGDFRVIINTGTEEEPILKYGPENKYNPASITSRIQENGYPYGFVFTYRWHAELHRDIVFDETGILERIDHRMTMADLLQ